jgi:hypothetical protein
VDLGAVLALLCFDFLECIQKLKICPPAAENWMPISVEHPESDESAFDTTVN